MVQHNGWHEEGSSFLLDSKHFLSPQPAVEFLHEGKRTRVWARLVSLAARSNAAAFVFICGSFCSFNFHLNQLRLSNEKPQFRLTEEKEERNNNQAAIYSGTARREDEGSPV